MREAYFYRYLVGCRPGPELRGLLADIVARPGNRFDWSVCISRSA